MTWIVNTCKKSCMFNSIKSCLSEFDCWKGFTLQSILRETLYWCNHARGLCIIVQLGNCSRFICREDTRKVLINLSDKSARQDKIVTKTRQVMCFLIGQLLLFVGSFFFSTSDLNSSCFLSDEEHQCVKISTFTSRRWKKSTFLFLVKSPCVRSYGVYFKLFLYFTWTTLVCHL